MRSPSPALAVSLGFCVLAVWPLAGFGQPLDAPQGKPLQYAALAAHPSQKEDVDSANLFTNGDFENGMHGWSVQAWAKKGRANVDTEERHHRHPSLEVSNAVADNTFVTQKVRVTPGTRYRLSCWVKTRDITVKQGRGNAGATLWIDGGWEAAKCVKNAENWTYLELDFDSGKRTEIQAGPRLGQWGGTLTGTAWFSEVSLVEIGPSEH